MELSAHLVIESSKLRAQWIASCKVLELMFKEGCKVVREVEITMLSKKEEIVAYKKKLKWNTPT